MKLFSKKIMLRRGLQWFLVHHTREDKKEKYCQLFFQKANKVIVVQISTFTAKTSSGAVDLILRRVLILENQPKLSD